MSILEGLVSIFDTPAVLSTGKVCLFSESDLNDKWLRKGRCLLLWTQVVSPVYLTGGGRDVEDYVLHPL